MVSYAGFLREVFSKSLNLSLATPLLKALPWLPSTHSDGFQNLFKTQIPLSRRNLTSKQKYITEIKTELLRFKMGEWG